MIDPYSVLVGGTTVLAGVIWAVRLEGKVNEHDQLFEEREKLNASQHRSVTDQLVRIENKLDKVTDGLLRRS